MGISARSDSTTRKTREEGFKEAISEERRKDTTFLSTINNPDYFPPSKNIPRPAGTRDLKCIFRQQFVLAACCSSVATVLSSRTLQ